MAIEAKKEATPLIRKLIHQEKEWAHFFQVCCEDGPDRLGSQAWQWRAELQVRSPGHDLPETEIRDALFDLAAYLLPESPAGAPEIQDEARRQLLNELMYWAGRNSVPLDLDPDRVQEAWEGTLESFRTALREWAQAGLAKLRVA